jgi:ribosome biogenesis GTPase
MYFKNLWLDSFFENYLKENPIENLNLGRITSQHRNCFGVMCEYGEITGIIPGHFRQESTIPCVGDIIAFEYLPGENKAVIQKILPRRSKFSRKNAGPEMTEQVMASNVDFAFITVALDYDFNIRRVERYLSLVWQSGAVPVVILTKSDLCDDIAGRIAEINDIAIGVDVYAITSFDTDSIKPLRKYLENHQTVILVGSSGVGKSTLINELAGATVMKTGDLRSNMDKGHHTTTNRQMIILENGGMIIDTPGMRELSLWNADEGINQTFADIDELVVRCRFTNCTHTNEPGCAIQAAIADGTLDASRFESFQKIRKEQAYLEAKQSQTAAKIERDKWKNIRKFAKSLKN